MIFRKLADLFRSEKRIVPEEIAKPAPTPEPEPEFDPLKMPIVIHSKYDQVEFLNKQCTLLEDFVINDQINAYDLEKLADLNRITLQIYAGWYPLVIELIQELDKLGWDKRVSCIKEKYASLRFYTDNKYDDLIEEYESRSRHICEICGERGENRHRGWEQTLCREHHLENTRYIHFDPNGFMINDVLYWWSDITNISTDEDQKYTCLWLKFRPGVLPRNDWNDDDQLFVHDSMRGYGELLQRLLQESIPFNYGLRNHIKIHFSQVEFCLICGYEAVYYKKCECCENLSDKGYVSIGYKPGELDQEKIKDLQLDWFLDDGELFESQNPFYPKNPEHRILFTQEELEERKKWTFDF